MPRLHHREVYGPSPPIDFFGVLNGRQLIVPSLLSWNPRRRNSAQLGVVLSMAVKNEDDEAQNTSTAFRIVFIPHNAC